MRTRDNNFLLDGIDNNELNLNTVIIFPSVDAIEEFKVQTSTYSAEFGRANGGVVNLQIKSGTNQFHGSGFEFLRNDKFDANDLFNNKFGRAKPAFRQNQFGGTLGGPIRHDQTFFFMDYQGWRVRNAHTYSSTVPTDLMRAGDFSELNRTIYDPLSQSRFPDNRIPASRYRSRQQEHHRTAVPDRECGRAAVLDRADHQQLSVQPHSPAAGRSIRRQSEPAHLG